MGICLSVDVFERHGRVTQIAKKAMCLNFLPDRLLQEGRLNGGTNNHVLCRNQPFINFDLLKTKPLEHSLLF